MKDLTLALEETPTAELTYFDGNARQGNVKAIIESLKTTGQYRPIVVNRGSHTGRPHEVLAGNHTLKAARALGWETITATWVDVDQETATRIVVADNRISDLATNDTASLAELLLSLERLEGTGYTNDDLDELIKELNTEEPPAGNDDITDEVPEPETYKTTSKIGDIFTLGRHRLICADSTKPETYAQLMQDQQADCMWTDPPYGIDYVGKGEESLTIQNDGPAGLKTLLEGFFTAAQPHIKPGQGVYIAYASTTHTTFEQALISTGYIIRQSLLWVKNTIVMGMADYHYQHEPIFYAITPGAKGRRGRFGGTGGWYGPDNCSTVLRADKPAQNKIHPTMKPIDLITQMLTNSCPPGGLIIDPFSGSGSTILAAEKLGMTGYGVELDPRYVDAICARFQAQTGILPVLNDEPVDFLDI